jgi:hypothetical protein
MAPQKMIKNTDAVGEGANSNVDVMSDTTSQATDIVKYWTQLFKLLEHELVNCPEDFDDEVNDTHEAKLMDIAQSEKEARSS